MHINCIKLLCKIINKHKHVSTINRHPQGDVNKKEYIILIK